MYARSILHLDLDAFFVSVERLRNSALEGKPLIVGGRKGGVVASCSYEARHFGVHSAMPIKMALRLCPDAEIIQGDMESYSHYSNIITEIIATEAPLFEKASIDEFYLDLSGMDKYFGCFSWAQAFRRKVIKETGLPISLGLSINKTIAKMGTNVAKPNGERYIPNENAQDFIDPFPIKSLPGVGKHTSRKLSFMGVRTIKMLRLIPCELLEQQFGKIGKILWERANGLDARQVIPYSEQKSISTERTFDTATIHPHTLRVQLTKMVTNLAFELRTSERLSSVVTVKIRYSDFNTYTKQRQVPYTANDNLLLSTALDLLSSLHTRRQLVRLIGIRFSGLVRGSPQLNLFDQDAKAIALLQQMDKIRQRFGKNSIQKAITTPPPKSDN